MPMLPATITAAPQGQVKEAPQGRIGAVPFERSAQRHVEQGNVVSGIAINVANPGTFNFSIPSYGYLYAVFLTFAATGGTGSAGVWFEDAPWSALANVMLTDVNGSPIFGPFSGYQAHLCSRYGGYRYFPHNPLFTATDTTPAPLPFGQEYQYGPSSPGTNATGNVPFYWTAASSGTGNWNAILPIWLAFGRNGLGSLPNMDASSRYQLQVTLASGLTGTLGPIYTTQPTGVPTVTLAVEALCLAQPLAADAAGNQNSTEPPAAGTIQYWTQQTFPSLSGAQTIQLSRVGNYVRNHILVFRDSSATVANNTRLFAEQNDLPPTIQYDWDSLPRYIEFLSTSRFRHFGVSGLSAPAGVAVYENTSDPDGLAGFESGHYYMPTAGATKLVLRFTPAANSVNLTVLTNDVVPTSGEIFAAAA